MVYPYLRFIIAAFSQLACQGSGHVLMENRNGLCVDVRVAPATGYAERNEALEMLRRLPYWLPWPSAENGRNHAALRCLDGSYRGWDERRSGRWTAGRPGCVGGGPDEGVLTWNRLRFVEDAIEMAFFFGQVLADEPIKQTTRNQAIGTSVRHPRPAHGGKCVRLPLWGTLRVRYQG